VGEVSKQSIGNFVGNLKKLTELINQTVKSRPAFRGAVIKIEGLNNVKVVNFVGLGAVRYTPKYLQGPSLAPEVRAEIDEVNKNLAEKLGQQDPLFSQGLTVEGDVCVCLGVETNTISTDAPTLYAQKISEVINNSEADRKVKKNTNNYLPLPFTNSISSCSSSSSSSFSTFPKPRLWRTLGSW
jgi:hypothetical protein